MLVAQDIAIRLVATAVDAVGNGVADDNGGLLYTFETLKNTQPVIDSTDTPVAIPDNDPGGGNERN